MDSLSNGDKWFYADTERLVGSLAETWRQQKASKVFVAKPFLQDLHSLSGTCGLHKDGVSIVKLCQIAEDNLGLFLVLDGIQKLIVEIEKFPYRSS